MEELEKTGKLATPRQPREELRPRRHRGCGPRRRRCARGGDARRLQEGVGRGKVGCLHQSGRGRHIRHLFQRPDRAARHRRRHRPVKAVLTKGGREAATVVAEGRAEMAVIYVSEAIAVKGVKVAGMLPPSLQDYSAYAAAIPQSSTDAAAARAFITALTSPGMAERWRSQRLRAAEVTAAGIREEHPCITEACSRRIRLDGHGGVERLKRSNRRCREVSYPDLLKANWNREGGAGRSRPGLHSTRPNPGGSEQDPPLTPEYIRRFLPGEPRGSGGRRLRQQLRPGPAGGPSGMPLMMVAFRALEFVVTPERTRRPGGRPGPAAPHLHGWDRAWARRDHADLWGLLHRPLDRSGRQRAAFDVFPRGRDPRLQGAARLRPPPALPLHYDNQSIFKERIQISTRPIRTSSTTRSAVIDHALDAVPWTVEQALCPRSRSAGGMVLNPFASEVRTAGLHRQGELLPERRRLPGCRRARNPEAA